MRRIKFESVAYSAHRSLYLLKTDESLMFSWMFLDLGTIPKWLRICFEFDLRCLDTRQWSSGICFSSQRLLSGEITNNHEGKRDGHASLRWVWRTAWSQSKNQLCLKSCWVGNRKTSKSVRAAKALFGCFCKCMWRELECCMFSWTREPERRDLFKSKLFLVWVLTLTQIKGITSRICMFLILFFLDNWRYNDSVTTSPKLIFSFTNLIQNFHSSFIYLAYPASLFNQECLEGDDVVVKQEGWVVTNIAIGLLVSIEPSSTANFILDFQRSSKGISKFLRPCISGKLTSTCLLEFPSLS